MGSGRWRSKLLPYLQGGTSLNDLMIIAMAGFTTGITTVLFGFGGGFVVVPCLPAAGAATSTGGQCDAYCRGHLDGGDDFQCGLGQLPKLARGQAFFNCFVPAAVVCRHGRGGRFVAGGNIERGAGSRAFYPLYAGDDWGLHVAQRLSSGSAPRRLSLLTVTVGGTLIGMIAAMLGVGGSVMTVPLLRRHGHAMRECISAANPLSLPVALCGTVTYAISGWQNLDRRRFYQPENFGPLLLTGWAGIVFSRRTIPAVPDVWHARIYVMLLCLVLMAMLL